MNTKNAQSAGHRNIRNTSATKRRSHGHRALIKHRTEIPAGIFPVDVMFRGFLRVL